MITFNTRKWIKPSDLNGHSSIFGGQLLSWIDEEAAIFAASLLDSRNIVTAHMSTIDFKSRAQNGDIIEIGCAFVKSGKTSITVSCTVRNLVTKQDIITVNEIVFVNLDASGNPTPHKLYIQNLEKNV